MTEAGRGAASAAAAAPLTARLTDKEFSTMQVHEKVTRNLITIAPEASIQDAAKLMAEYDIGELPVCAERNNVVGVVTDRDITVRATAKDLDPHQSRVESIMTRDLVWCHENWSLEDAAKLMKQHQIRRIFVRNDNNDFIGVIALGDLAASDQTEKLAEEILHDVSQPSRQRAA